MTNKLFCCGKLASNISSLLTQGGGVQCKFVIDFVIMRLASTATSLDELASFVYYTQNVL